MRPLTIAIGIALVFAGGAAQHALAQDHHGGPGKRGADVEAKDKKSEAGKGPRKLPLCPVMGDEVDFHVQAMTADGPVYFCCPMCISKFEKEPEKYAEKLAAQREALKKLERIQVKCPVTGNPIDGKTFVMHEGQGVWFCCGRCVEEYQKDAAKYRARLQAAVTYQTVCPVGGEKIDPTVYRDLPTGQRVYFCCKGCGDKLLEEPAKYAHNLEKQGIRLDLKKLKEAPKNQERQDEAHDHHRHGRGE